MEYCPECGIGLNIMEKQLRFCQNCKSHWNEDSEVECDHEEVMRQGNGFVYGVCKKCGEELY